MKALAKGRFIPIGDGENRRTLIYDRDVARAAVLAAGHPAAAGKIFNVSDGQFHTLNEIIEVMCRSLGRRCPHISVPVAPVRFAVGVLEDAARLFECKFPIGRATIDKYTEDVAVDSQRIRRELGFVPRYDLVEGWRETVEEMRSTDLRNSRPG
ncbi:MAG: NAD-dependent epimerase/dehydratase family protein [Pseudomonadota bacterium]